MFRNFAELAEAGPIGMKQDDAERALNVSEYCHQAVNETKRGWQC